MVEWTATDGRVCGFGSDESVVVRTDGWQPRTAAVSISALVDTSVAGETASLVLPADTLCVDGIERHSPEPFRLDGGEHQLSFESGLETHVAFESIASVERHERGVRIAFPESTTVTIGFREAPRSRLPVTVPQTPAGLATAISAAASCHETDGPKRSHPGFRPRTPAVTFGELAVPPALSNDSTVSFRVPSSTAAVLVAAPLAYYLGANVHVGAEQPRLVGDGLDHTFGSLPSFAPEAADLLQRLVWLDSLLRDVPGEGDAVATLSGVDRDALRTASPAERLSVVLELSVPTSLTWPLTAYVDDDPTRGRFLPYLLDRLSVVYPADSSPLDPKALLERSLDEFYRGDVANVDAIDPTLATSRFHVWLAEGIPIDAYTLVSRPTDPEPREADTLSIVVVVNDDEMLAERDVADIYRSRLGGRRVDVDVRERCLVHELATVFETPTDLVHFVGHCERDGLLCPDGVLSAADLDRCRVSAFLLNACGSYHEGYELVRQGAVVGGVTLTTVLDRQAMTVGTNFAGLLADGFDFETAMSLARGQILTGRDYAVVGDGSYTLVSSHGEPAVVALDELDGGAHFVVTYDPISIDGAGRRYRDPFCGGERLYGEPTLATLDRDATIEFLARYDVPVRYNGSLYGGCGLAEKLSDCGRQI